MWLLTAALIAYSCFEIVHTVSLRAVSCIALAVQILISGLLLTVPRMAQSSPGSVHFGARRFSEYTPEQRRKLMPILRRMAGAISVAMNLFCVFVIHSGPDLSILLWAVGLLVANMMIIFYYL